MKWFVQQVGRNAGILTEHVLMGSVAIVLNHLVLDMCMCNTLFPSLLSFRRVFSNDLGENAGEPTSMNLCST